MVAASSDTEFDPVPIILSLSSWRRLLGALVILVFSCLVGVARADSVPITFPDSVQQGSMVIGRVPPGSQVTTAGRELRVPGYGTVVFGVGRDASGRQTVSITTPDSRQQNVAVAITPRDWPIERIDGVPPKTVSPPPEIARRIQREQAAVSAQRTRNDDRVGFAQTFVWPVKGRISGRFGNQRIYNGTPGSAHSGMDIAAAELGMDPAEIRRKNFPDKSEFPFNTAAGLSYDSGDYHMTLDRALENAGYADMRREQEEARKEGRYLGIGLSTYVEVCGMGPSTASARSRTPSTMLRILSTSLPKSAWPGVSTRLTVVSP